MTEMEYRIIRRLNAAEPWDEFGENVYNSIDAAIVDLNYWRKRLPNVEFLIMERRVTEWQSAFETCTYCGEEFPTPVSLHHSEEECRDSEWMNDERVVAARPSETSVDRPNYAYVSRRYWKSDWTPLVPRDLLLEMEQQRDQYKEAAESAQKALSDEITAHSVTRKKFKVPDKTERLARYVIDRPNTYSRGGGAEGLARYVLDLLSEEKS